MANPSYGAPQFRVKVWPPSETLPTTAGTSLEIAQGKISISRFKLARTLSFSLPVDHNFELYDDYNSPLPTRGWWIQVEVSDGLRPWAPYFIGTVRNWGLDKQRAEPILTYECQCRLGKGRSTGVNLSEATAWKMHEGSFDSGEFSLESEEAGYVVDLEGTGADNGEEWVPAGLINLVSYRNNADSEDERQTIDYGKDEWEYDSNNKRIYFIHNQAAVVESVTSSTVFDLEDASDIEDGDSVQVYSGGALTAVSVTGKSGNQITISPGVVGIAAGDLVYPDRVYDFRLYYYDPADTSNTVKAAITRIATRDSWSYEGGLGYRTAEVDLEPITGLDGVTEKRFRSIITEKVDGPIGNLLDDFRDSGMLPYRYWLRDDPATGKLLGSYLSQENAHPVDLTDLVLYFSCPRSLEGVLGKVEMYCDSVAPQNLALNATVTVTTPSGYTMSGDAGNVNDGRVKTPLLLTKEYTTLDVPPTGTAADCLVLDIHKNEWCGEIWFRGAAPQQQIGGKWEPIPIYHVSRLPKITISASMEPITVHNPGIPVSPDAISIEYDPQNIGSQDGYDVKVKCVNIKYFRYVAIRWEQDFFYRRDGNNVGNTARQSLFGVTEVKILSDGRFRYKSGPDEGEVPFAQLTDKGSQIGPIASRVLTVGLGHNMKGGTISGISGLVLTVGAGHPFVEGDRVYFWDTSAVTYFQRCAYITATGSTTITVSRKPDGLANSDLVGDLAQFWDLSAGEPHDGLYGIQSVTDTTVTVIELPAALVTGDSIGWHRRWNLDLSGAWTDLYFPRLKVKIKASTAWVDPVNDDRPAYIQEAEALAVEQLMESILISSENEIEFFDLTVGVGSTVRSYSNGPPWAINELDIELNPEREDWEEAPPAVLMVARGTNYEEAQQ